MTSHAIYAMGFIVFLFHSNPLSLCDSVGDGCERVRETGGPRPGQADPFG